MSPAASEVWERIAALPPEDQDALAERLAEHLGPPGDGCTPDEWKAAWHAEVVARLERFDRGETTPLTLDEAAARMRKAAEDARR